MLRFSVIKNKIIGYGLFHKILLILILTIVMPTFSISLVNYYILKNSLESEVSRSNLDTLKQTREAVDNILILTERISNQIFRNQNVQLFLEKEYDLGVYDDVKAILDVINPVQSYTEGAVYIDRIFVYSFINNMLLSSDLGYDKKTSIIDGASLREFAGKYSGTLWVEPYGEGVFKDKSETIQLIKFFYRNVSEPQGFIVIYLKKEEFSKLINNIYIRKSGFITVANESGRLIINAGNGLSDKQLLEMGDEWKSKPEGFNRINNSDDKLLFSYTTSKLNNWKYIAVLPVDELENKSDLIRNNIIIICGLFTIFAVFLSLAMTRGIYNPIVLIYNILKGERLDESKLRKLVLRKDEFGRINHEISRMTDQLSSEKNLKETIAMENEELKYKLSSLPNFKNYFLYRIMTGDTIEGEEFYKQAEFFNIPVDKNYFVFSIKHDRNFREVVGLLSGDERNSYRLRILNLLYNTISEPEVVHAFYEETDIIIGTAGFDNTQAEKGLTERFKLKCRRFQEIVASIMNFSVTVSIGNSYFGLENIRNSYTDVKEVMKYQFILGNDTIILNDDIKDTAYSSNMKYNYERYLKNSLETKKTDLIVQVIKEFRDYLKKNMAQTEMYSFYFKNIISIISQYLKGCDANKSAYIDELNNAFINFEREFDDVDEVVEWLCSFIIRVFDKINSGSQPQLSLLTRRMLNIIQEDYNKDLSLSELADRLSISLSYLSRLFKEEIGKNFKEYLTEVRIDKAKKLLGETSIPIQEIAEEVGYSNSIQFSRIFKKYEHITPGEYRLHIQPK